MMAWHQTNYALVTLASLHYEVTSHCKILRSVEDSLVLKWYYMYHSKFRQEHLKMLIRFECECTALKPNLVSLWFQQILRGRINWWIEAHGSSSILTIKRRRCCLSSLADWGRVTHICVGTDTNIGSDNGLSPSRRQAIIWTNAGILLIGPLGTNFSGILSEIHTFSFKKMHFKTSSAK